MLPNYKWSHLADVLFSADLTDGELAALYDVWRDQRSLLADDGEVAEFSKRLSREWAIETGILERAYTLDRGTTKTLIEEGIKASLIPHGSSNLDGSELAAILDDHLDALEGLFAFVKGERELTVGYVKEVHSVLLRHVATYTVQDQFGNFSERELIKGDYKTQPNSPTRPDGSIHEYCPPEHVAAEMDRLVEIHREHMRKNVAAEVEAAWFHHAFTQIHPFSDGNGRVARLLASLVFIKRGGFPLLVRRDDNAEYIGALETADKGDLRALVALFMRAQRRALLGALQALPRFAKPPATLDPRTPEEVIAGVRDIFVNRGQAGVIPREWEPVNLLAQTLYQQAQGRMGSLAAGLQNEIGQFNIGLTANAQRLDTPSEREMVATVAGHFGYVVGTERWQPLFALNLNGAKPWRLIFSLHPVGQVYRGVMAALLLVVEPDKPAVSATDDIFQLNYKEASPAARARFQRWLEAGLTRALTMWRETL